MKQKDKWYLSPVAKSYIKEDSLADRALFYLFAFLIATVILGTLLLVTAHAEGTTLQASWYSRSSLIKEGTWKNGKEQRMADGKKFNDAGFTCATRDYPLGSRLMVRNISNGKSVVVVVTDRIGRRFIGKRIDLSKAAFAAIENLDKGITKVEVSRV